MTKFLIATHGELAKEFVRTAEMIVGNEEKLDYISMKADTRVSEIMDYLNQYFLNGEDGEQFIILTDVIGGSINNICMEFMDRKDVHIIAGVNLPMILELVNNVDAMSCTEVIAFCVEQAKQNIIYINNLVNQGGLKG